MITKRIWLNVAAFLALAGLLIAWGAVGLVFQKGGGRTFTVNFTDAAGLLPRNDVTMRGVPVGQVSDVALMPRGVAHVTVALEPGITVPQGTEAEITRRSPIGDMTLELTPGKGAVIPNGGSIPMRDTIRPPDPERTIALLARVLHSVPSQDLSTVVHQLAIGLRGRGPDLAALNQASRLLPERILEVRSQLSHLIRTGPRVTGVLAANSKTLADDLSVTADLADILRDNRFNLVHLSQNGARFLQVANALIASEKPNLACLVGDFGTINATLAEPQHLSDLESTLDLNHYFFDAVVMSVQTSRVDHYGWFRVQLLPPQQPPGHPYQPHTPPNDVFEGNACHSIYGLGVGPASQPGPVWLARGSKLHVGS
jgi:phospholipid/cholesterol/gamma-HCH transport system substrate-binding protein